MAHSCVIAGREVELAWSVDSEKRFAFRMSECGGEPSPQQLTSPKTAPAALCKVLWALLPVGESARYPDPESLFVAIDHEKEGPAIFAAISGVYSDRFPDLKKKASSKRRPSRKSNSA